MLGLHRIATDLRPIYELKILHFLDSWAVAKHLSLDRKLAFTSMLRSDWHTSKQKGYNWPSNKTDLRSHHDRLACSPPSHAIRKSIGMNSGPRITTTARPPWYTFDRPLTDLWCFATDQRPTHDVGPIASSYLPDSAKVCMSLRWKFQEWLATDLRSCRMTYEATEWFTTNLWRLATKGGSSCELGHSQVKLTTVFWRLKAVMELVDFNGE